MKSSVSPGKYVLAVSGGVDSMVLLDMLCRINSLELIVAHFNHGIRNDAHKDEKIVRAVAKKNSLEVEVGYGRLGKDASEEKARKARYDFLESVKNKHKARRIITAHHQDDLIETVFLNIMRGSGQQGVVAIQSNPDIERPLLMTSKQELIDYAEKNKLKWREDTTNNDESYLRNYIRINVLPDLGKQKREALISNIEKIAEIQKQKNQLIATISQNIKKGDEIGRSQYIALPTEVRAELIMNWLRELGVRDFDKKTIEKVDLLIRVGLSNTRYPVKKNLWLKLNKSTARFDSHP